MSQLGVGGASLDGFVVAASGLWPHDVRDGETVIPSVAVSYFDGTSSRSKLAAYLVAHMAAHVGGLTATMASDADHQGTLVAALRVCTAVRGSGTGTGAGGEAAESIVHRFVGSLANGGWDIDALQLAEDGYRLSVIPGA